MDTAANHPPTCHICRGSGWQRGPDIHRTDRHGHTTRTYTTAETCTHHWANDEQPERLISLAEYLRRHPHDAHLFNRSEAA